MSAAGAPRAGAVPAEFAEAVRRGDWAQAQELLEREGDLPTGPLPDKGDPALLAAALWRLRCGVRKPDKDAREKARREAREKAEEAARKGEVAPTVPHPWKKQAGLVRRLVTENPPDLGAAVLALDWPWPSRTPWALSDEELARWVAIVGGAPRCDGSTLALLQLAFRTRIRSQWRPSAATLGALAARDPEVARPAVVALLLPPARPTKRSHPDPGQLAAALATWEAWREKRDELWGGAPHDRRHALTTLAAWHVVDPEGAEASGVQAAQLFEGVVPTDASDRSAALLALATLAAHPDRAAACLDRATTLVAGRPSDPQTAEALVELAAAVPAELRARALGLARQAVARTGEVLAGAANDWAWARAVVLDALATSAPDELEAFVDEEPELAPWALLRLVGSDRLTERSPLRARAAHAWSWLQLDPSRERSRRAASARAALEERLRALTDRPGWELLDPVGRAILVGEAVQLATSVPELIDVRWELLAERAGWPTTGKHARAGRTGDVAGDAIVLALDRLGVRQLPEHLVRSARLTVDEALELASRGHGFLDTQLALALERALRRKAPDEEYPGRPGAPDDPERAQLLFRLLQRRPSPRLVQELAALARDGELRGAARALLACITYVRGQGTPPPFAEALEQVDRMLKELRAPLAGAGGVLADLDRLRARLDGLTQPGLRERFTAIAELLPAPTEKPRPETITGLLGWLEASSADAATAHTAATAALDAYRRLDGLADIAALLAWREEVARTLAALAERTACLPEPNAFVIGSLLAPLRRQFDLLRGHLAALHDHQGHDLAGLARANAAATEIREWLALNRVEGASHDAIERSVLRVVRACADAVLHATLDEADEVQVVDLVTRPERTLLLDHASEPLIIALRGWLLDRYLIGVAWFLVRQPEVRRRGVTGGVYSHFSPVFFGVPVGTLQVAQLAELLDKFAASPIRVAGVSMLLVGSILVYMAWDLLDRPVSWAELGSLTLPGGRVVAVPESRLRRAQWAVRRPLPIFGAALLEALLASILFLWLADDLFVGEGWRPKLALLTIWTSLTLFVGVFVGLIAAGRRMGGR